MSMLDDPLVVPDTALLNAVDELGQTIVHCKLKYANAIRIWKSAVLIDNNGKTSALLHVENIAVYPNWTIPKIKNNYAYFTLIFEGLSKNCINFYLDESIPEPGGFYSNKIAKNNSGVYEVEVFS